MARFRDEWSDEEHRRQRGAGPQGGGDERHPGGRRPDPSGGQARFGGEADEWGEAREWGYGRGYGRGYGQSHGTLEWESRPESWGRGERPNEPGERHGQGRFGPGDAFGGAAFLRSGDSARESDQRSYRGRGPRGYGRSDERLRELICERLTDDDDIDPSEVSVEVSNGEVTLTGSVDDRRTKYLIEEVIEDCGVTEIHNRLRIDRGGVDRGREGRTAHSESRAGESPESGSPGSRQPGGQRPSGGTPSGGTH